MKTIVITGSTRGIGYGLAENFLRLDQQVVISGRSRESVDGALQTLAEEYSQERMAGFPCDVRKVNQVEQLWNFATNRFGRIDVWVNNAGIATARSDFWQLNEEQITSLVDTNITGAMFGAKAALSGFMNQGGGEFYNMEGLGSDGRRVDGLTLYGTSKRALNYLTESLAAEVEGSGVIVGALSPGMVLTDLILERYRGRDPEEWQEARRIFNILAERVETVTPFLADKVLENNKNGARISWLTPGKILWRFLTARFSQRDLFADLDLDELSQP